MFMFAVLLLIIGLIILVKSSDAAVKYGVKIANNLGISEMAVGFLLMGIATSLPELMVVVVSSFFGEATLGLGTVVGSNIADIGLVIGIIAFAAPFTIIKTDYEQIYKVLGLTSLIGVFALILGTIGADLGVFCLIVFGFSAISVAKQKGSFTEVSDSDTLGLVKNIGLVLLSILIVIVSADVVTNAAVEIANILGIAKTIIGASIIAVGTSLPEVMVSLEAARKGNHSIAIGNVTGSLLANLSLVLGTGTLITPIVIGKTEIISIGLMLFMNLLFFILSLRKKFGRKSAIVLLTAYAMMMFILFSTK